MEENKKFEFYGGTFILWFSVIFMLVGLVSATIDYWKEWSAKILYHYIDCTCNYIF